MSQIEQAEPMSALIVRHTAVGGTVLLNTSKGDGAADALRTAGFRWRWSRHIEDYGAWYVPHTRDRAPALGLIERYAEVLRAAGFTVTVSIDATPRPMEEAEADRAERMGARAERLADRAVRQLARSDAYLDAADDLTGRIPLGQPILVGHHSERRARADQERIHRYMGKFSELRAESVRAQAAAEATDAHMGYGRVRRWWDDVSNVWKPSDAGCNGTSMATPVTIGTGKARSFTPRRSSLPAASIGSKSTREPPSSTRKSATGRRCSARRA
jgi:Domain of unknown function (DUF3560)